LIYTNIDILAPLGKSDHAVLSFRFNCYVVLQNRAGNCYNYNKGNYASLREMMDIDWLALLQPLNGDPDA